MSEPEQEKTPSADESGQAIQVIFGERAANSLLDDIRAGVAHPDALTHCVTGLPMEALRGFGRYVQKALER